MSVVSIVSNQQNLLLVPRGLAESGASIVAKINAELGQQDWQTGSGEGGESNTGQNVGASGAGVFKEKSGVTLRFRKIKAGANVTVTENADDITIASSGGGAGGGGDVVGPASSVDGRLALFDGATGKLLKQHSAGVSAFAASTHGHAITDVTGLQTALDGKQAAGSYAASTHGHAISDVTSLQTALDAKAATGHGHDAFTSGAAGFAPASGGGTANFLRADGAWAAPAGEANTAANLGDGAGLVYKEKSGVELRLRSIKAGPNITVTNNANDITIEASGGGSMTGAEIATALQGQALTQIPSFSMRDSANTPNATYTIQTVQRALTTTDGTDTEALAITLAEGEAFSAEFWMTAFKSDGTGVNTRMNLVTGRRPTSGSANATASSNIGATANGTSAGTTNVSTSGNTVSFNVRGEASTTYRWFVEIKLKRFTP